MKTKYNLAAFTEHGQQIFHKYLEELATDSSLKPPFEILNDPICSYNLNIARLTEKRTERTIEIRSFENKYDFAQYIKPIISDLSGIEKNSPFWNWLTLAYFDSVCPVEEGHRKKLRNSFYIHDGDYRSVLKHHLAGTYLLYNKHGSLAKALLLDKMNKLSYFREHLISRKNFINCKPLLEVMNKLYFDDGNNLLKKGVTKRIKNRKGKMIPNAGTHRRLLHFEKRLERNYDFYSMTSDQILSILPNEFDIFKNNADSEKVPLTEEILENGNEFNIELDGIKGVCKISDFGTFSDRLGFKLEEEHPDFKTDEIITKYFDFPKPGVVKWRPGAPIETSEVFVINNQ